MDNTPFKQVKPAGRNMKKIALIALASIVIIGLMGFGTLALLKQLKAPTISSSSQSTTTPPLAKTPEQALKVADDAYMAANKKATSGDQKAALADYKTAYENYKLAKNSAKANDTKFAIDSINAVLATPQNPANPAGSKTSAKQ